MRVGWLTRELNRGRQRGLHGGTAALNGVRALLSEVPDVELVHVEIPETYYDEADEIPELRDLRAVGVLDEIDWRLFDKVVCNEWGFAPYLACRGVSFWMMIYFLWNFDDGIACKLESFARFCDRFICPTAEAAGFIQGWSAKQTVILPTPVDYGQHEFVEDKRAQVIWVGRDDAQKRLDILVDVARDLSRYEFHVFASYFQDEVRIPNVVCYTQAPREELLRRMHESAVLLLTSDYEVYATVILEGLLSGCRPVAREIFGVRHYEPYVRLSDTRGLAEATRAELEWRQTTAETTARKAFIEAKFGRRTLLEQWKRWIYEA